MKPKILTDKESKELREMICPDCGAVDLMILGPKGGMSRNAVCGICKTEFNVSFLQSERIGQPCSAERQAEVYQLDKFPVDKWENLLPVPAARLGQMGCSNPDCKDPDCNEIWFRSGCHNECEVVSAVYYKHAHYVAMFCGQCRRPILKIQVSTGESMRFRRHHHRL